jgi:uncharacterized membrane protein YhfC
MQPQTVSAASILCMCVSLLICVGVPAGLAIWAKVKYKKAFSFLPLLGGAVAFVLFQIIIRVSILLPWLQSTGWPQSNPLMYAIFLSITAGLFEEPARFLVFAMMKKKRGFPDGFSYGIGHGGIEAILLVGLTYVNYIVYSVMINSGTWGATLSTLPDVLRGQYVLIGQGLVSSASWTYLIGGAERLCTIFIQIALSLVVLKGFQLNKKWLYLAIATILHALIDFPAAAVGLQLIKINGLILEGFVIVVAVISALYILKQARNWRKSLQLPEVPVSA